MPKIVLRCDVEADLLKLESQAADLKLPVALIRDAGHTVVDIAPSCQDSDGIDLVLFVRILGDDFAIFPAHA